MTQPVQYIFPCSNIVAPVPTSSWDPDLGAFQDNGTTPAVANNDPIELLNDQVGSLSISNTGTTSRPLLQTNAINGRSAILFGGGNPTVMGNATALAPNATWIFAINQVSWADFAAIFGGISQLPVLLQYPGAPTITQYNTTAAPSVSPAIGTWVIVAWQNWTTASTQLLQINLNAPSIYIQTTISMSVGFEWGFNTFTGGLGHANFLLGRSAYYDSILPTPALGLAIQQMAAYYGLIV